MSTPILIGVERFTVKHRITLTENFYELRTLGPNDEHGEIFAFAWSPCRSSSTSCSRRRPDGS